MEKVNKEILINTYSLWTDIQSVFSMHYPFLKIEYIENDKGTKVNRSLKTDTQLPIKQITNVTLPCKIDIHSNRSVVQVSLDFKIIMGLKVKVLRKSGNVWNVISITEGWTLENQNAAGKFISSQMLDSL